MRYTVFGTVQGKERQASFERHDMAIRYAWRLIDQNGNQVPEDIAVVDSKPQSGPRGNRDVTPVFLTY